jgi:[protein-PII] uridylyltransferase
LDPGDDLRFPLLSDLETLVAGRPSQSDERRSIEVWNELAIQPLILIAALAASAFEHEPDPAGTAATLAGSIGLEETDVATVAYLVAEIQLLPAAARRLDMGTEDSVLELAAHIGTLERAGALYVLAVAGNDMEVWQREALDEQFDLVRAVLKHPDLPGGTNLVDLRRDQIVRALSHLPRDEVRRHLADAPRRYLVALPPESVARHLAMTAVPFRRGEVRLETDQGAGDGWTVHVATRDKRGLLACIAWALAAHDVSVSEAYASTWRDGKAIDVFQVDAPGDMDWEAARDSIANALVQGPSEREVYPVEGIVDVDNVASPWYTILEVRAHDRTGLLYRVASALSEAGLTIHTAQVTTSQGVAVDVFQVTTDDGGKLGQEGERQIRLALLAKTPRRRLWPWLRDAASLNATDLAR